MTRAQALVPMALVLVACASAPERAPRSLPDSLAWSRSAEHTALCLQVFNLALEKLQALPDDGGELPRAIVMDLDETVLDNFGFQLELARDGASYDSERWEAWVQRDEAVLLPGAARFIDGVRALGIEVVLLSNRSDASRSATLATLRRLALAPADGEPPLYLKRETGNKEPRRQLVEARYRVLAYFGDNLADFDAGFEAEARGDRATARARACAARERWGGLWFVLPNPMYGAWKRPTDAAPLGTAPAACP